MLMEESPYHTVVISPFLQLVAVNPTVRIKNHALDTNMVVAVVQLAIYIRPTARVQVVSSFMQQKIQLKQCTS